MSTKPAIRPGDRVRFTRPDGVVVEDTVRQLFTQTTLLEPYGRNQTFPAAVLTEHSWAALSDLERLDKQLLARWRMRRPYRVAWDNGHASGVFSWTFASRRAAESWAREWKRETVAQEGTSAGRREARAAYSWDVVDDREGVR